MSVNETAIRRVTGEDVDELSRLLARAFLDDPIMAWLFPRAGARLEGARRFFAWALRHISLPLEEVWRTPHAVALWAPPGRWRVPFLEQVRLFPSAARVLGARTLPAVIGFNRLEARHPGAPHWYLYFIGTDPARQRQGEGRALMSRMIGRADAEGVGMFLEASTAGVVPYYERFGFRTIGELSLPGGPRWWLMWREPGVSSPCE